MFTTDKACYIFKMKETEVFLIHVYINVKIKKIKSKKKVMVSKIFEKKMMIK